jgi:chaperonin GroES
MSAYIDTPSPLHSPHHTPGHLRKLRTSLTSGLTASQSAIKSIRAIAPLLDRILVQRIKPEAKTAGGLFLPETAVKELNEAKVLAVGPGAFDREGKRVAPSVQPGDKVLIPQVRRSSRTAAGKNIWHT